MATRKNGNGDTVNVTIDGDGNVLDGRSNIRSVIRDIYPTDATVSQNLLEYVTDVTIDNRAIGYRATPIGGRDASFEPMAELIVRYDLEQDIAGVLMDPELLAKIFNDLFPKKETYKLSTNQGMLTIPMLVTAFLDAMRTSGRDAPTVSTLAHIMAELTAHSLRHLNLILPYDGVVSLTTHDVLFPDAVTILEAARVARITNVLESMKLDPEIGRVKTLSAASLLSALQPMFARAGRLMITTVQQDMYLDQTLLLLRLFVTKDPALPKVLLTNADLQALASNLTYVLAALSRPPVDFSIPEYFMERAISESTLTLRSLKRFSTKHISEVKDWYVHYVLRDAPGQHVTGLIFGRNMVVENRPQVSVFTQVGTAQNPLWTQTAFNAAENRVEPLLTKLFGEQLNTQAMAASMATVATYAEIGLERHKVMLINGANEIELKHYAAAVSKGFALTVETEGRFDLVYLNEDEEQCYTTGSLILGTQVVSQDPAEAIIHSGLRENVGTGSVPSRVQGIPDTNRNHMLLNNPDTFTTNLAYDINIDVEIEGVKLTYTTSLAQLLVLPSQLRLSMTNTMTPRIIVSNYVDGLLKLANSVDITAKTGEITRMRAATLLSSFMLAVSASPAGKALLKSIMLGLINSVPRGEDRENVRGRLRNAVLTYQLAIIVGGKIMVALGLLTNEQAEDVRSLIDATHLDRFMVGSMPHLGDLI